ncbi:transcriptional regulator [Sphaerochaeta pleomorpha str. Grapes]|uniref:Transcriptional regulator n=1 Tax=Sphaerochaeta pleomorpha (strain ATCC BAA-1885 / DSM 22778 / Grapes) TaxID=158190 RepID=G8QV86_SPHPG|nr:LacI family DNA-binding transcriptional regulator [Sphaerochaeta pleomorpha]AEV30401.1 transcriptional regulator [Sphaerochaeta pleomorpha str. Grapes]
MKREGENPITIREVARCAGVSIATVSRVINDSLTVTPKTREKVSAAMIGLGYTRNEVARSLKIRHTRTIGIIAPELSNTFFMEVLESMEKVFSQRGYTMVICSSSNSVEEEQKKLQVMMERTVDALVIIPVSDVSDHFQGKMLSSIPMVIVDRQLPRLHTDTVLTDNRYGVQQVIKALVQEGFTRIGFIGGSLHIPTAKERYAGYLNAMEEANLTVEGEYVFLEGAMDQKSGYSSIQRILQKQDHPQAFFIANDLLHLGATTYLMETFSPGNRPSLVFASFDYLSYSPLLQFCHYAVFQPLEEIGKSVAELLLRRLDDDWEGFPQQILFKPEIKVMHANATPQLQFPIQDSGKASSQVNC